MKLKLLALVMAVLIVSIPIAVAQEYNAVNEISTDANKKITKADGSDIETEVITKVSSNKTAELLAPIADAGEQCKKGAEEEGGIASYIDNDIVRYLAAITDTLYLLYQTITTADMIMSIIVGFLCCGEAWIPGLAALCAAKTKKWFD